MASKADKKDAAAASAASSSKAVTKAPRQKELYPMPNWKYDLFLYSVGNIVDMFFREVVPRGAWRVPQSGPVLFVAAPHANQVRPSSSPSHVKVSVSRQTTHKRPWEHVH
jgi:glycerol-3-phosphate O-acyltransferase/dihydroxyacetone phosphate acyltransferase